MPEKTAKLSMFSLILYNLTGGRIQMNDAQDPVGLFALTTTGRKSGQPRTVSLIYIKSGSAYAVAATNAGRDKHPGWYFNLLSNPQVMVRIKKTALQSGRGNGGPSTKKTALGATGRSSAYVCALRAYNQPRNPDGTLAPGRVITKHCDKALSIAIYNCSSRQLLLT